MSIQILIVDDEADVRNSMDMYINHAGFATQLAASAEEGLDLLEERRFEVVITDIMLPGVSGLDQNHQEQIRLRRHRHDRLQRRLLLRGGHHRRGQ